MTRKSKWSSEKRVPRKPPVALARSLRVCSSSRYMDLDSLHGWGEQVRVLTEEGSADLRRSLLQFGLFRPLLVQERDGGAVVLGGNQTLVVLKELVAQGYKVRGAGGGKIPVVVFAGNRKQAKLVALRDNRHSGDWNYVDLGSLLKGLVGRGVDPLLAGFKQAEVDELLALFDTSQKDGGSVKAAGKGGGQTVLFRFKVGKGEAQIVRDALGVVGGDEYEPLARMCRLALEAEGA